MDRGEYQDFLKESLEKIQKAHRENYLSIFAGAGVSVESELPSWEKLIKNVKNEICFDTSKDNHLSIADKFYFRCGNDTIYYEKLKEIMNLDHKIPNELHDKIVNLNTRNIITTNWDNLFEKAINNNGKYFDIIRKDDDMGYTTGRSKLIKMHGDLEEKNIVFRETDYLEYSRNFPLIENYVKAIFSTDVVILVGYSLGDYNVKQILSWLRCNAKTKPIYFIKTGKEFETSDFDYYKEQNIFVLYLEEKLEMQGEKSLEQLSKFFEHIATDKKKQQEILSIISVDTTKKIQNMLANFDNESIRELIKETRIHKNNINKQELLRAFLLYQTQQYRESYKAFKQLSEESFKHRQHKIWYISEFNRKNLINYLNHNPQDIDSEDYKMDTYLETDLEDQYFKLPINIRDRIGLLRTLELDWYKSIVDIYKLKDKIHRNHENFSNKDFGTFGTIDVDIFLANLYDFEQKMIRFCIIQDYKEYYNCAMEILFIEKSIGFLYMDNVTKKGLPAVDIDMPEFLFSYSVRYCETNNLKEIFDKYYNDKNYFTFNNQHIVLSTVFRNICSLLHESFLVPYNQWFQNFLIIAAWIKLDQNTFNIIIDEVCNKLKQGISGLRKFERLNYFIVHQYNKNKDINFIKLQNLICTYMLIYFTDKHFNAHEVKAQMCLFDTICNILKEQEHWLTYKEHGAIVQSFMSCRYLLRLMVRRLDSFLINIYSISEEVLQKSISNALRENIQQASIEEINSIDMPPQFNSPTNDTSIKDLNSNLKEAWGDDTLLSFCKKFVDNNILTDQDYQDLQKKYSTKEK